MSNFAVVIRKQIHACFASMSSSDIWVERPLTPECKPIIDNENGDQELGIRVDFDQNRVVIYLDSDRTFYEKALAKRDGPLGRHYNVEKDPDFKALIQTYLDDGWKVTD